MKETKITKNKSFFIDLDIKGFSNIIKLKTRKLKENLELKYEWNKQLNGKFQILLKKKQT